LFPKLIITASFDWFEPIINDVWVKFQRWKIAVSPLFLTFLRRGRILWGFMVHCKKRFGIEDEGGTEE
jgi:hypothetical protein